MSSIQFFTKNNNIKKKKKKKKKMAQKLTFVHFSAHFVHISALLLHSTQFPLYWAMQGGYMTCCPTFYS